MARKKLSEWKAKVLISQALQIPYKGYTFTTKSDIRLLDESIRYVVKVDEGIKKRMKKGLVNLNRTPKEVKEDIERFAQEGYSHFIVEPFIPHNSLSEKYVSIERVRDGLQILYSDQGGIDVEKNSGSIKKNVIPVLPEYSENSVGQIFRQSDNLKSKISGSLSIPSFLKLLSAFNKLHFSFLEINPFVIEDGHCYFLDIAAEVDSAGEYFVHNAWTSTDWRTASATLTNEEKSVADLSQKSQASFNLTVLNPNGSIFMLLSGGGASIVLADEVYDLGYGKYLANYGEYSGNPNAEEVYLYTKNILELLIKSEPDADKHVTRKKVLIIGGGVANFTNIVITFKGIMQAIEEKKKSLQEQGVKIFVRRGGPHQDEGLAMMKSFLKENNLYGLVADQKITFPEIIKKALEHLQ